MKLLVSVVSPEAAKVALSAGIDILDIKNPEEGSLGASFPWIVEDILKISKGIEVSAAIGDFDFKPGLASLASYSLSKLGVKYVKIGFYKIKTKKQALKLGKSVIRALNDSHGVFAAYADYKNIGSISPFEIIEVGEECGASIVMIDTINKRGKNLLNYMGMEDLKIFVDTSHEKGLKVALAGSLDRYSIAMLKKINPDIVGVRGAVCEGRKRTNFISRERIIELKNLCQNHSFL